MQTNRIQNISRISALRAPTPVAAIPAGFVLVPAQVFQSQGTGPSDWQRNLYAAAFEQARRSVLQTRQRMFARSQFVAVS